MKSVFILSFQDEKNIYMGYHELCLCSSSFRISVKFVVQITHKKIMQTLNMHKRAWSVFTFCIYNSTLGDVRQHKTSLKPSPSKKNPDVIRGRKGKYNRWRGRGVGWKRRGVAHVMSSVEKLETMLLMKFSLMMTARIAFQSVAFSPSRRQIDSKATLTFAGGLAIERTSTRCCFFIDFTAAVPPVPITAKRERDSTREETKKAFS